MPLVRRKKVMLHDVPEFALAADAGPAQASRDVFYIPHTGEIFPDYESYSQRMAFYSMKVFQCELTGKSGLDYFQALDSERSEAATLHARFPAQLKAPVLSAVQWQIMGRLDHLVELVYDRFVNRYFAGEKVFVLVEGEKYYARIIKVFPPKSLTNGTPNSVFEAHSIGVDLRVPIEDAQVRDDPLAYFYTVRLIQESADGDSHPHSPHESGSGQPHPVHDDAAAEKWSGSEMEVKADSLSRDRLSFSKSILRRFIRDCVDRDPAVASPWTVKKIIAEQHGVATVMSDDIKRSIEGAKAGEKDKRKKVWEDKLEAEGVVSKKRKKDDDSETQTPTPAFPDAKPKPRGPIKYPIDDLDVVITDREKKSGKQVTRPQIDRDVPFGKDFEPFLMSWAFFQSFGTVLKISSFTLDDYENALRHNQPDTSCALLAETHACLLAAARERAGTKYIAIDSLEAEEAEDADLEDDEGDAMDVDGPDADVNPDPNANVDLNVYAYGTNPKRISEKQRQKERRATRWDVSLADIAREAKGLGYKSSMAHNAGSGSSSSKDSPRPGWEDNLAIYIRDHATVHSLPNLRRILQDLIFEPDSGSDDEAEASGSQSAPRSYTPSTPADRYIYLLAEDKIAILAFLTEICIACRSVRAHIDWGDASLTELRKEKIEVNREKRRLQEEISQLDSKIEPEAETPAVKTEPTDRGTATPLPDAVSSPAPGHSEDEGSAAVTQNGNGNGNTSDATEDTAHTPAPAAPAASAPGSGSGTGRRKRPSVLRRASGKFAASDTPTPTPAAKLATSNTQSAQHGKDRAQARIKAAELKSAMAERRRLDEELNKTERRLEQIERQFRALFGVGRTRHMGRDRFFNRYWWLDGMGIGTLVNASGGTAYGTGRVFVQGPSEFDLLVIRGKGEGVVAARQKEEDGPGGTLAPGEWGVYTEAQEIEELVAWFNPKGHRELALKNALSKWMDHITSGIKRRLSDLAARPERRSTRGKGPSSVASAHSDGNRESYLTWVNRHHTQNGR